MLKARSILLIVLFWALILRLWGIAHGLPHIYSVDEPALVRSVMGLRFDLNPHHFDWPHFHFYFCYFFFVLLVKFRSLLQVLNLRPLLEPQIPIFWQDPQIFYLEMRVISALMGVATVGLVYLIGEKLFDRRVGLLGAALLSVYPFHNEISHYALLEAPLTFWITLSFLLSVLVFKNGRLRDYLLAGFFAGLAASTKYNGALAAVPIVAAALSRGISRIGLMRLILSGLAAVGGFFLGTPYAVLDRQLFLSYEPQRGFLWQMSRVGAVSWSELPRVFWERLGVLVEGSGVVVAVLASLGFLLALRNRQRKGLLLLSFPLVYFFYIARLGYFNAHYFVPLAPFLSILAALVFWFLLENVRRFKLGKIALYSLFLILFSSPPFLSARSSFILSQPDTRQLAADWVEENVAEGSKIAQKGEYQPVLSGFELIGTHDLSTDWLEENKVAYVIVTSYGPMDEDRPGLTLVKKIVPNLQPGPAVLIYKVVQ